MPMVWFEIQHCSQEFGLAAKAGGSCPGSSPACSAQDTLDIFVLDSNNNLNIIIAWPQNIKHNVNKHSFYFLNHCHSAKEVSILNSVK